jgi:hypothetical protein
MDRSLAYALRKPIDACTSSTRRNSPMACSRHASLPDCSAPGNDPVEDRQLDHRAITVKELCIRYLADLQAGLILGKGGSSDGAPTMSAHTSSRGKARTTRSAASRILGRISSRTPHYRM